MTTILITGGTGLIGSALAKFLAAKGCQVIILSRRPKQASGNISYAAWDPLQQTIDANAVQQADYIVNLAGAGINDKRWSKKRKEEIITSRVQSGSLIVKALKEIPNQVKAVIGISGIAWYGDDAKRDISKRAFTETDPADDDYLGQVCVQWENAIKPVDDLEKRLVILRCPPVFSNTGGAFVEFKKPVTFGIAAILGNGRQIISWVHIEDFCRMIWFAIENEKIHGIYNAASPQPISNRNFTLQLAEKVKGRYFIPVHVPVFMLKLAVGGVSVEVLKSATISSEKISQAGFQFLYPSVDAALHNLLGK
jgi:uncharacterized protein (TIGR01777 family)